VDAAQLGKAVEVLQAMAEDLAAMVAVVMLRQVQVQAVVQGDIRATVEMVLIPILRGILVLRVQAVAVPLAHIIMDADSAQVAEVGLDYSDKAPMEQLPAGRSTLYEEAEVALVEVVVVMVVAMNLDQPVLGTTVDMVDIFMVAVPGQQANQVAVAVVVVVQLLHMAAEVAVADSAEVAVAVMVLRAVYLAVPAEAEQFVSFGLVLQEHSRQLVLHHHN
jgi:hypothetical protein